MCLRTAECHPDSGQVMALITASTMPIQGLARDFGTVNSVKIFEDANNGKSKGAAEIEFAEPAAAAKCKAALHGCDSGPTLHSAT